MKKTLLLSLILILSYSKTWCEEEINREWFFVGVGTSYALSDEAIGFNTRFGFPMQKGLYFVSQATYLPDIMDFGYEEFRYEFNIELTFFTVRKISIYGSSGLNFGRWKRNWSNDLLAPHEEYFSDNSLLFGGGITYNLKEVQLFADYKYYPKVWNSHASIGVKIKFFGNKDLRKAYYNFLKRERKVNKNE